MERASQLKPFVARVFITGYKQDDVYRGAGYTNLVSLDAFSLGIFCKENRIALDENGHMIAGEDQTWVDVPIPHRGGYAFEHSDDGLDTVMIQSFFDRCTFENVEKFKAITGVMGPVQVIEAVSVVDYIRQTNAYDKHNPDPKGWGEDTYQALAQKHQMDRETFDKAMDLILKGFGILLAPFPVIDVQDGRTGYRLSQALGGSTMTNELLARIFSTATDCLERRNSQLMPIYDAFLQPIHQSETLDREVERRFLQRGMDIHGNPLTPEEVQERMNAPIRDMVEKAHAKMADAATSTPEERFDALQSAVSEMMHAPVSAITDSQD